MATKRVLASSAGSNAAAKFPCVVLFGWTGSQERYLKKYQQTVWEPLKYRCCLYTRHCNLDYSDKVLRDAIKLLKNEQPACIHLFSNGAGFLWRRILRLAHEDKELHEALGQVKLIVYDSTPGDISAKSVSKLPRVFVFAWAFLWEFFRPPFARAVLVLLKPFLAVFNVLLWFLGLQFLDDFNWTSQYHNELLAGCKAYKWSNLFLYSKDDALIDYLAIEHVMKSARDVGCAVSGKCWAKSVHVQHLPLHETDYVEQVKAAAGNLLESTRNPFPVIDEGQ
jgi:hypothetical protein